MPLDHGPQGVGLDAPVLEHELMVEMVVFPVGCRGGL